MSHFISAIFLDRDGTINIDKGYINNIDNFQFINGAIEAMQELKKMGFALVLVTNQSGLARGIFSEDQFVRLMEWMKQSLAYYNVYLDGIYFCPHHPQAIVDVLRQECNCRKPKPGMLLDAQRYLNIEMVSSYMVGDKLEDMLVAKAVGVGKRVLVRSGKKISEKEITLADLVIDSLASLPAKINNNQL